MCWFTENGTSTTTTRPGFKHLNQLERRGPKTENIPPYDRYLLKVNTSMHHALCSCCRLDAAQLWDKKSQAGHFMLVLRKAEHDNSEHPFTSNQI